MANHPINVNVWNLHVTGVKNKNITTLRAKYSGDERYCVHNVQPTLYRGDISKASAHPQPQGNAIFPIKKLYHLFVEGLMLKYDTSGAEDDVRQAGPRLHNAAEREQHGQALWPDDHGGEIPGGRHFDLQKKKKFAGVDVPQPSPPGLPHSEPPRRHPWLRHRRLRQGDPPQVCHVD